MADQNRLDQLVDSILSLNPILEVTAADALKDIAKCIFWRGFQQSDHKTIVYSVVGVHSSFSLFLEVRKGSLLTTLWNIHARFDDEYCAYFDSTAMDSSADSSTEIHFLWHVRGIDIHSKRINRGFVNWTLMRSIQDACCIKSIGVQAFSKLFVHLLLCFPAFILNNLVYSPPMPATFMHNYLLIVESCPVIVSIATKNQSAEVKNMRVLCEDGSNFQQARWITNLIPYYASNGGQKVLCHPAYYAKHQLQPMFTTDTLHDIGVRIVEIFATKMAMEGFAVVLEVVNKRRWIHTVRFVVTNTTALKIAMQKDQLEALAQRPPQGDGSIDGLLSSSSGTSVHLTPFRSVSENAVVINECYSNDGAEESAKHIVRLYDEMEWFHLLQAWRSEQRLTRSGKSVAIENDEDQPFGGVDFRNSCTWGALSF